jgi:chromosome segregation ATPase
MYRKEMYFHNETKEELKGASEIINSYKKELNEKEELIKKLVEHTQKMTLENIQLKDEAKNIKVLEIENKMMKRMISKRQKGLLEVHLKEELEREERTKKMLEGVDNGTFFFPKKKDITI